MTVLVALGRRVSSLRMGKKTMKPGEGDRPRDRGIESYQSVCESNSVFSSGLDLVLGRPKRQ